MAKVLYGAIKSDGKVYAAGTPYMKLPKDIRAVAIANDFLVEQIGEEVVSPAEAEAEDTKNKDKE